MPLNSSLAIGREKHWKGWLTNTAMPTKTACNSMPKLFAALPSCQPAPGRIPYMIAPLNVWISKLPSPGRTPQ